MLCRLFAAKGKRFQNKSLYFSWCKTLTENTKIGEITVFREFLQPCSFKVLFKKFQSVTKNCQAVHEVQHLGVCLKHYSNRRNGYTWKTAAGLWPWL